MLCLWCPLQFMKRKRWPQLLMQELVGAAVWCLIPYEPSPQTGPGRGRSGWKVIFASPATQELLGYKPEEIEGQDWADFVYCELESKYRCCGLLGASPMTDLSLRIHSSRSGRPRSTDAKYPNIHRGFNRRANRLASPTKTLPVEQLTHFGIRSPNCIDQRSDGQLCGSLQVHERIYKDGLQGWERDII